MIKTAGCLWTLFALVSFLPDGCPENGRAKDLPAIRRLGDPTARALSDCRKTNGDTAGFRHEASGRPDAASDGNVFFSKEERRILSSSMGLVYRKPAGFDEVSRTECFEEYPELKRIVSCAWNWLRSDDGECVVCLPIYPPLTEEDTLFVLHNRRYSPDDPLRMLDRQHVGQTRCHIVFAQGEDFGYFLQRKRKQKAGDWRRHLCYYTQDEARRMFGADTAYRYSLNIVPGKKYRYEGKYDSLDVLVLQKKGRGYVMLFCFTTEKGQADLPCYWRRIETIFRYEDRQFVETGGSGTFDFYK